MVHGSHPLNAALQSHHVEPSPPFPLTPQQPEQRPWTTRGDQAFSDEKTPEETLTAPYSASSATRAQTPLMPTGRSSNGAMQQMAPALAALTSPAARPPVATLVDPRIVRPSTSSGTSLSLTPRTHPLDVSPSVYTPDATAAMLDALSARVNKQRMYNSRLVDSSAANHLQLIRTERDLESWVSRAHDVDETNAQLRYLLSQTQLKDLELAVLRRDTNHFKDRDVEALMATLAQTQSQLKIAEHDVAVLLKEKKAAMASASTFRKVNEAALTRTAAAEREVDEALQEAKICSARYARNAEELDAMILAHDKLERQVGVTTEQLQATQAQLEQSKVECARLQHLLDEGAAERATLTADRNRWMTECQSTASQRDGFLAQLKSTENSLHAESDRLYAVTSAREALATQLAAAHTHAAELSRAAEATALTIQAMERAAAVAKQDALEAARAAEARHLQSERTIADGLASVAEARAAAEEALKRQEGAERTLSAKSLQCEQLGAQLESERQSLFESEALVRTLKAEGNANKESLTARVQEVSALNARVMEQAQTMSALRGSITSLEEQVALGERNLSSTIKALQASAEDVRAKAAELGTAKIRIADLQLLQTDLTKQLAFTKESAVLAQVRARQELVAVQEALATQELRLRQLTETHASLQNSKASADRRFEELQTRYTRETEFLEAEKATAALELERLTKLYEETAAQMDGYAALTAQAHQALHDEIASQRGQIELLQQQLLSNKQDQDQMTGDYERLVASHRLLHSQHAAVSKRTGELETQVSELTAQNKLLSLQLAAEGIGSIGQANLVSRGSFGLAASSKRASMGAAELDSLRRKHADLTTEMDEERKKSRALAAASSDWERKYGEIKAQYDELIARTPFRVALSDAFSTPEFGGSGNGSASGSGVGFPRSLPAHMQMHGHTSLSSSPISSPTPSSPKASYDPSMAAQSPKSRRERAAGASSRRTEHFIATGDDGVALIAAPDSPSSSSSFLPSNLIVVQSPGGSSRGFSGLRSGETRDSLSLRTELRSESEEQEIQAQLPPRAEAPVPTMSPGSSDGAQRSPSPPPPPPEPTAAEREAAAAAEASSIAQTERDEAQTRARLALTAIPLAVGLLFQSNADGVAGVTVTSLKPGQAAELAGLAVGDCILSMGGRATNSKAGFLLALRGLTPGEVVDVELTRKGQPLQRRMMMGGRDHSVDEINAMRRDAGLPMHEA